MAAAKPGVRPPPKRVTVQTGNVEFLAWHGPFKPETLSSWLGRDLPSQKRTVSGLGFWSTPCEGYCSNRKHRVPGLARTLQAGNVEFLAWQGPFKPETYSFWLGILVDSLRLTKSSARGYMLHFKRGTRVHA